MPNPKEYYIKGKLYQGIELTEGEQLVLLKINNDLVRQQQDAMYLAATSNISEDDD